MYYCSRECQKKHWSKHKLQCRMDEKNDFLIITPVEDKYKNYHMASLPLNAWLNGDGKPIRFYNGELHDAHEEGKQAGEGRQFIVKAQLGMEELGESCVSMPIYIYNENKSFDYMLDTSHPQHHGFANIIKTKCGSGGSKGYFYAITGEFEQIRINMKTLAPQQTW